MKIDRLNVLLKQNRKLFHTRDLALLWGISNQNTLYTTISRYLKRKILSQIHKGYYSLLPIEEVDRFEMGAGFLHRYCYVGTETILSQEGIIQQKIYPLTYISEVSESFKLGNFTYLCRKLQPLFLYNSLGIYEKNKVLFSDTTRAVCDLLYYNPHYHLDNRQLIDWEKVKYYRKEIYDLS